jgi:hypothetical protein
MKTAIMQPYLFPYIGYFQLIESVDLFVSCDNMQYTKKGWINRNRFLHNGKEDFFTLPIEDAPQKTHIKDRYITSDFNGEKLIKLFERNYRKSACFSQNFPLLVEILSFRERNLFEFLSFSLQKTCAFLGLKRRFLKTSDIPVDHSLKKEDKVISICKSLGTQTYINAPGGRDLYSNENFKKHAISLRFLNPGPFCYAQAQNPFVPWLSIVDVLMFNPVQKISEQLSRYELAE